MARGMILGGGGSAMQIGDVTLEDKSDEIGQGFLKCDGSAIDQSKYPLLYSKLVNHKVPLYYIDAYIKSGMPAS